MNTSSFKVSLSSDIQVSPSHHGYRFTPSGHSNEGIATSSLVIPAIPGLEDAINYLQQGTATSQELNGVLKTQEQDQTGVQLAATLQQLDERGWLNHAVPPLAIAVHLVEGAHLNLDTPHWNQAQVSLSRFAYQHSYEGGMVLESPLSKFRVKLLDWRASGILAQLAQPQSLRLVTPPPQIGPETAYQFLNLLWSTGFLSIDEAEAPALKLWDFHNLLFHSRCRQGRHDYPTAHIEGSLDVWDDFPVVKPPMSGQIVALPQLSLDSIRQRDRTLTTAIEKRQSIREYDDKHPITIVILDGNPDHTLSCFTGAEISKVFPYWHQPTDPVPNEAYLQFQAIDNNEDIDKDQKAEAQKAAFSDSLLKRIHGDNHACHITSTIVGQENTPSPGLAPNCRVINVPLNTTGTDEEFISPINLARAFELGLELGANIIHCAACRPTQTGEGEELLLQALKKCQDNNILIVAPAGNDKGECWCMPASLPSVLSVGALKPDGTPYKFSNWGGNNALEGIMAPGGEILGAQPANEEPVRLKGTSMAAPVMTGLCGLLMSLQLQQGKPIDAEAIRAALLNTAIPCTAEDTDEPERCLRGKVNLPGAMGLLFGESVTISFAGSQVTRTEHQRITASDSVADVNSKTMTPQQHSSHNAVSLTVSEENHNSNQVAPFLEQATINLSASKADEASGVSMVASQQSSPIITPH